MIRPERSAAGGKASPGHAGLDGVETIGMRKVARNAPLGSRSVPAGADIY